MLMEETQYQLHQIFAEMNYCLVMIPVAELDRDCLRGFFVDQQDIWRDVSRRWIEFCKLD